MTGFHRFVTLNIAAATLVVTIGATSPALDGAGVDTAAAGAVTTDMVGMAITMVRPWQVLR